MRDVLEKGKLETKLEKKRLLSEVYIKVSNK